MQNGWPDSRTLTPCLRISRAARFTWKTPKRSTRLGDNDFFSDNDHRSLQGDVKTELPVSLFRNSNPI
jgi:hypothetical protein